MRFTRSSCIVFVLVLVIVLSLFSAVLAQRIIQNTDPQQRLDWFSQHQQMKENSSFKDMNWQFLGPTNVSGRVTDIAVVEPVNKNYTIYVATASGGVWKTVNEGTTWEPVFDQAISTSIGNVEVAPSNPDIVWVGTGEANIFRSSMAGAGVFKSTDAGKTWRNMGLTDTNTIPRIVIHPANPDIVYVAAGGHEWTKNEERGLYKTTNGGRTWEKIFYVDDLTGGNDLVMDPRDPNTLYLTTWQRVRERWNDPRVEPGYSGSAIYKTTDGGENWTPINDGLPEAKFRGRIGIDICKAKPNVLYSYIDNYDLGPAPEAGRTDAYGRIPQRRIKGATVFRSDNSGSSWRQVSETDNYMMRVSSTYGWVFGQIRVDPNDEDTVYIMGVQFHGSEDGGKTFKPIQGMHSDHHALWIDPDNSNYLINGNDGGIVISYDKGKTWKQFTHNLPVVQFFNISYDMATPFHVYGSVQDHGSYRGAVNITDGTRGRTIRPVNFQGAPGGEGSSHAIDPRDPNIVYSAGFYGTIQRSDMSKTITMTRGNRVFERTQTESIMPVNPSGDPPLRGQWVAPFIISPHDPDVIYHGMQYLFRSMHRGENWERISPDLTYNNPDYYGDIPFQTLMDISESPFKFGLIYVGTDDGRVHITKDGGSTWKEIMKGLPYRKHVSRIVASKYDPATVYMTQNGKRDDDFTAYIWKSTDYGQNWVSIKNNIPCGPVNVIREDPQFSNVLYVGTDIGVYISIDSGNSWEVLGGNLPSTFVSDMRIHPRDNIVIASTHGRGVWVMDANPIYQSFRRRR
ncbi:WD40/YVTN/BNR-like repeat-containing protein [candidate division KSB1 bacterium]